MESLKLKNFYILKLEPNEEIVQTLKQFVIKKKIKGGFLWGLGTAREISLGYYDLKEKQYRKRLFVEDHEITSLIGNISYVSTDPIIHIHVVISPENFVSYSGHLFQALVSATAEILLMPFTQKILRKAEPKIGLNLLSLVSEPKKKLS
jgi:predicted DNA-binding protein with PD1-like motif